MRKRFLRLLIVTVAAGTAAAGDLRAAEPRYLAEWVDGSQSAAEEVLDWSRSNGQPSIAGKRLFDSQKPVRLLIDTTLPRPAPFDRYIELRCGDRLPGRIVKFVDAELETGVPAHLVVEVDTELGYPKAFSRSQVRVLAEWVRRIVQHPPADVVVPAKALRLKTGASRSFQELRWRSDGVEVLTDSGVEAFAFTDIVLLDAGPWKSWDGWLRLLAVLCPGIDSRLVRVELADGTRLTTSLERLRPRSQGGDNPEMWYHLMQPAWSLDLLAAAHRRVRVWTFLASHEAPLSAMEPNASRHRAVFSQAWGTARIDQNVRGEPLRAAGRDFAWGFGVHAHHELEFELPQSARRFHTKLAIDPWAGPGGCVRGRILLGEQTLFNSPLIIGTGPALDCGLLAVRPGRLLLIAEAETPDRPAGADPFDIRDFVNWLEPTLELAPGDLRREIAPHFPAAHARLAGWTCESADVGNFRLVNRFDDSDRDDPGFRQLLQIDAPVTLTRQVAIDPRRPAARLEFGRPGGTSANTRFEIVINGRRILREAMPGPDSSGEPLRIVVPLDGIAENSVEFSVRLDPAGPPAQIDWRGLTLVPHEGRK